MKFKNYGLDIEKERTERSSQDWKFGALSQPSLYAIPPATREAYLPTGEVQRGREDTQDCASRAPNNILAPQFTYAYQHALMRAENAQWLRDNGYVVDGRIDFSDAFVSINSGTTRQGNSLKAPLEAIRKQGLIPKALLPLLPTMTWAQYNDPSRITDSMRELGKEFVRRFTINYEQVDRQRFADVLANDFLDVALFAWPSPRNGEYPRSNDAFNHAVAMFALPTFTIFDNYEEAPQDFIKKLASDYRFFDYGYRLFVSAENVPNDQTILMQVATALQRFDLLDSLAKWWKRFTASEMATPTAPTLPPSPSPVTPPHVSRIRPWALAIQAQEGGRPNDLNMRLNNPGNLKYSAYTASLGGKPGAEATDGGRFCTFDTYEKGLQALQDVLTDAASDKLRDYHQSRSLEAFTMKYANVPATHPYARQVAAALGVPVTIDIKELL